MARYAVRCCCQPRKIFGYLELPAGLRHGDRVPIYRPVRTPLLAAFDGPAIVNSCEYVELRILGHRDGRRELAVYSDDRPEEFWRDLPNFTPAPPEQLGHNGGPSIDD